jgi:hypothetical protein
MSSPTPTAWVDRPGLPVVGTAEQLAELVDAACEPVDGLLFTTTARLTLHEIGQWQQVKDRAMAGQLRAIVDALAAAPHVQEEFVADEVSLALRVSVRTGSSLVALARQLAELPGLLESMESGDLSERHLRMLLDCLAESALTLDQKQAIVLVVLARLRNQTPGQLQTLVRRLVLRVDAAASEHRKEHLTRQRGVQTFPTGDDQGVLSAMGPVEQIAAMRAALDAAMAATGPDPDDPRSKDEREFDLLVELICGRAERGHWQLQVVVPYSTAAGGELELAEIPGFGPVLPSTAQDLADLAGVMTQVAVDHGTGEVLGVSDAFRLATGMSSSRAQAPEPGAQLPVTYVDQLLDRPLHTDPVGFGYRAGPRLTHLVEARDRTCVFPGCSRPAVTTDKDHRTPWPRGRTDRVNLQSLCRRHHRAKQASFIVSAGPERTVQWTTRGGWVFTRDPEGY